MAFRPQSDSILSGAYNGIVIERQMGGDEGRNVDIVNRRRVVDCRDLPECYTSGAAWLRRRTKNRLHLYDDYI